MENDDSPIRKFLELYDLIFKEMEGKEK